MVKLVFPRVRSICHVLRSFLRFSTQHCVSLRRLEANRAFCCGQVTGRSRFSFSQLSKGQHARGDDSEILNVGCGVSDGTKWIVAVIKTTHWPGFQIFHEIPKRSFRVMMSSFNSISKFIAEDLYQMNVIMPLGSCPERTWCFITGYHKFLRTLGQVVS